MLQEIKALQEQEHALQKESLSVRLKVEHIDTAIAECHNKIKHWEKEVLSHRHTSHLDTDRILTEI